MAAQNLQHVRDLIGEDLTEQVERISAELGQQTNEQIRTAPWVDHQLLRGIPAVGGVITDSTIPGSDDHLEALG